MPPAEQRQVRHRADAQARLVWLRSLRWTDDQLRAFDRADRLRYYGAVLQAEMLVAQECAIPIESGQRFEWADLEIATGLDIYRWYAAFSGRPWNGSVAEFQRVRQLAARRARGAEFDAAIPQPRPTGHKLGLRAFRTSHLLVEVLDAHPKIDELRDYTHRVGWQSASNVGYLHWNDDNGMECAYCAALLLPSETQKINGAAHGVVCGLHCCAKGHACRSQFELLCLVYPAETSWSTSRDAGRFSLLPCQSGRAG